MLRGRRLFIVRVAWIVVAALTVVLFVASVPAYYDHIVCPRAECADWWRLQPNDITALHDLQLSVSLYRTYLVALEVVYALGFFIIGAFIFWKKSNDKMALLISMALILSGGTNLVDIFVETSHAWRLPVAFITYLEMVSFFISFCIFPNGHIVPRWIRASAAAWIIYQVPFNFFPSALFGEGAWGQLNILLFLGLLGTLASGQIYRYVRVSGPEERQQIKWVVFGLTAATATFIGTLLVGKTFQSLSHPGLPGLLYVLVGLTVINFCSLLVPLSIGIAILRYRLWEIDVIIHRSLVYSSLSAVLTALFSITDTVLQSLFFLTTGVEQSRVATLASVIFIAVVFQPVRNRIDGVVNRFVRQRIDSTETGQAH